MLAVSIKKLKPLLERRRHRKQLEVMDQRMLNDLALSRVDAHRLAGLYPMRRNEEDWRIRTMNNCEKR